MGAVFSADTYQVDTAHSFINFKVKRAGFSYVAGRFNGFNGSATWDESDAGRRSLEITIQTESVDTGNERRDQHLKSPDFFNAKQFPVMTFKSTNIKDAQVDGYEAAWEVTGELSLHGVSKPLTFVLRQIGRGEDRRGSYNVGLQTDFTIKRSEFGMTNMIQMGGDEVHCSVDILVKKQ
jgi:polyisoprenoid-binding protein YceI